MLELIQSLNAGVALILVLLVLINPKGYNKRGNQFLGFFMFSVFLQMFDELIRKQGIYEAYPHLGMISLSFLLAMPVLLFLGILFYVKPNREFSWRDLKFFVVLGIYYVSAISYGLINSSFDFWNRDIQTGTVGNFYTLLLFLFIIQLPIFWYKGHRLLNQHKYNVNEYSAAREDINLDWLYKFNYLYLVMILMFVVTNIIFSNWMLIVANLVFLIGLLLMALSTLKQEEVFPTDQSEKRDIQLFLEQKSDKEPIVNQPQPKILTKEKEDLLELMVTEKPYLDNEINLSKLANMLNSSTHQLSATLNNAIGMNFSNFINSYRIEEAKEIILDPKKQHYTMVQVAFEAGYNSKTVFNTHFKKTIGRSPSAFKKENIQANTA